MKYTYFGFSQKKAVEMNLDLVDLAILRYFIDFKDSGSMALEIIDGEPHYWVKYDNFIKANPILGVNSPRALSRRLKKLIDCDVLKKHIKKQAGTFTFYAVSKNYIKLLQNEHRTEKSSIVLTPDSKVQPSGLKSPVAPDSKVQPKDSSINDSSIKDSSDVVINNINTIKDKWNEILKTKINNITEKEKDLIIKILKQYSLEDILKTIDKISKSKYLLGEKDNKKADMSWFFKLDNFIKVSNGFYDDREEKAQGDKLNKHNNRFHNFNQRTDDYTSDDIENLARKKREKLFGRG